MRTAIQAKGVAVAVGNGPRLLPARAVARADVVALAERVAPAEGRVSRWPLFLVS